MNTGRQLSEIWELPIPQFAELVKAVEIETRMQVANMAMSIGIALDPSGKSQKAFEKELTDMWREPVQSFDDFQIGVPERRPRRLVKNPEPLKYGKKSGYRLRGVRVRTEKGNEIMRRLRGK